MAAWRIGRAWRRYRRGPARAARLAAVVAIQAAWRGFVGRRLAGQLRKQRDVMRSLEVGAGGGGGAAMRGWVHLSSWMCDAGYQKAGICDCAWAVLWAQVP